MPETFDTEAATYYAVYEPVTSSGITINPEQSGTVDYAKFVSLSDSESRRSISYEIGGEEYGDTKVIRSIALDDSALPEGVSISSCTWYVNGNHYASLLNLYETTDETLTTESFDTSGKTLYIDTDALRNNGNPAGTKIDITLIFTVGDMDYSINLTITMNMPMAGPIG